IAGEAQAERYRFHAPADLLRARRLDDDVVTRLREGFLDPLPFPELRIEIEAVYELREAIAAQDFLFDHVQAAFELAADRGLEDRFRYRPLDEYHRRPAIEVGQVPGKRKGRRQHGHERGDSENLAPSQDLEHTNCERIVCVR